jgi:hypothetical protein
MTKLHEAVVERRNYEKEPGTAAASRMRCGLPFGMRYRGSVTGFQLNSKPEKQKGCPFSIPLALAGIGRIVGQP